MLQNCFFFVHVTPHLFRVSSQLCQAAWENHTIQGLVEVLAEFQALSVGSLHYIEAAKGPRMQWKCLKNWRTVATQIYEFIKNNIRHRG